MFKNQMENLFEITCEIYLGKTGAGKSLVQTELKAIEYLKTGQEVWCCFWINWAGPNYHYFAPGDFDAVKNLRNCVVIFDELAQTFEPRQWEQEGSEMRRFFQLHRHRHVTIIGNTQDVSLVAKTIGIIAHKWYYLEPFDSPFLDLLTGGNKIRINVSEMNFQQLKKMAAGWELEGLLESDESIANYDLTFDKQKLLHYEMDDLKVEYHHKWCPKCCIRMDGQIRKEDEDKILEWDRRKNGSKIEPARLKVKESCPKCKGEIVIKESGMYDSYYEPPNKVKNVRQVMLKKVMIEKWVPA